MAIRTTNQWKLGLFIVLTVGMGIASLFWLAQGRFRRDTFPAVAYFNESVQGLDVGSPMKFRGVPVGVVSDITIAPDRRHVQVTSDVYWDVLRRLGIRADRPEPRSSTPFIDADLRVQLATTGITGVKYLDVDVFDPARTPLPELPFPTPWNYIPSQPSMLRSLGDALTEVANRLPAISDQASGLLVEGKDSLAAARRLATKLGDDDGQFAQFLASLHGAATRMRTALDEARIDATAASLRHATDAVAGGIGEARLGATAAGLRDASSSVASAANGVGDQHDDLRAGLVAFREALESAQALVDSLDRDPAILLRGRRSGDGAPPAR
jgi:phospholipid/cholesterol/gamma-HCH transport system substrate-binding protein